MPSAIITLAPEPSIRREDVDAFGNFVTRLEFDLPHDHLDVLGQVAVEVCVPAHAAAEDSVPWEEVRDSLAYSGRPMREVQLDACRFRMESSYVRIKQVFSDYAADCFPPGCPLLQGAASLMHKIHRDFSYAPGSTNISTSAIDAFTARRGVCQDFAHILLACLRARGLGGALRQRLPADRGAGGRYGSVGRGCVACLGFGVLSAIRLD